MSSPAAFAPPATPATALLARIDETRTDALAQHILQPIHTERAELPPAILPFTVRWISSIERKHAARERAAGRRDSNFNPFLPPEPALTVGPLGDAHLAVLNKFPVIDRHLLVITRAYEAQTAPLSAGDFAALARVLGPLGGLGFYNGGATAGASQHHKHLQWIPAEAGEASLRPYAGHLAGGESRDGALTLGALPFRHAFVSLAGVDWTKPQAAGAAVLRAFHVACAALDLPPAADPMPPYNLLLDRDWLLVVPRRCEHWEDISVNALGFGGSLFVRRPAQIDAIRSAGPLTVLAAVSEPA
jgi:ATP adenylyltransferase